MGVWIVVLGEDLMQGCQIKGFTGIGGHEMKSVNTTAWIGQHRRCRLGFHNRRFYPGSLGFGFTGFAIFHKSDNPVKLRDDGRQYR